MATSIIFFPNCRLYELLGLLITLSSPKNRYHTRLSDGILSLYVGDDDKVGPSLMWQATVLDTLILADFPNTTHLTTNYFLVHKWGLTISEDSVTSKLVWYRVQAMVCINKPKNLFYTISVLFNKSINSGRDLWYFFKNWLMILLPSMPHMRLVKWYFSSVTIGCYMHLLITWLFEISLKTLWFKMCCDFVDGGWLLLLEATVRAKCSSLVKFILLHIPSTS